MSLQALAVVTVLGRHCARMAMFNDAVENAPSSFAQAGALVSQLMHS